LAKLAEGNNMRGDYSPKKVVAAVVPAVATSGAEARKYATRRKRETAGTEV